jgi:hypothetical protein
MRTLKHLLTLGSVFCIAFSSCDVIEGPFIAERVVSECSNKCRKILLEDYTGHLCGNCPRASEKITELKSIYGDQLVIIAVHSGFFAEPSGTYFTNDFRTKTGNEWDEHFGNSAAGNPNGMVNRAGYSESSHILQYTQWAQKMEELLQSEPKAAIELETNYNANTYDLTVTTEIEILQTTSNPLSINLVLTESNVVGYQKDYDANPEKIPNYQHNHIMRKSLTGSWGKDLGKETYQNRSLISNTFHITLDEKWLPENMSIVAFITKTNTLEVIQAQESPVIK